MKRQSFLHTFLNNLKCLFCREKNCSVRYSPDRKSVQKYDGTCYVTHCRKDIEKKMKKICK